MCLRWRQTEERQRQMKDDGSVLDGCWAPSSCCPFCPSGGHSAARLGTAGSAAPASVGTEGSEDGVVILNPC